MGVRKGKGVERSVGVEKGGEPASDDDDESDSIFGLKVDFELYDPDKDEWEMLPPIQPCWPYTTFQSSCNVDWALFKDETTLLVKFSLPDRPGRVLQFEMDINERIWRLSKGVLGAARAGEMTITAVVRNELCFTPYKVVDNEHGSQSDLIPSSFDYKIYEHGFRSCFVFDEHYFYVVQASRLRNSLTAKLSVRKYFLNIEKYYLGRSELERRERGQHGIVMRNEITQMVRLGMPLEKLKLAISLLCEGRLKLKWGWQPPIEMELISSSQFVVDACTFIMPLQTLSLFQLPASQKRKRPSSSMC